MAGSFLQSRSIWDMLDEPLTRWTLREMKTRSLRRGIWYRALSRMERGLIDLAIRWVDRVRNKTMARVLLAMLEKLALAMQHGTARLVSSGRMLALKASELAVGWGNESAYSWRFDRTFWLGLSI